MRPPTTLSLFLFVFLIPVFSLSAQQRHIHSSAGVGGAQLPLWAGRDLGTFRKYQLDVEAVLILGGARGMQALLGGSTQSANMAAMVPIRTSLAGGDAVIVGGFLNKNLLKFVAQKTITKPGDLRGKKVGIANFGGSNEFGVLLALREWGIPREAVNIIPAGGSAARLTAMDARGLDATVISYDHARIAAQKGMTILGDLAEIVPEFPDRLIVVRRSFLDKERDVIKRFLQALSESIYQVITQREKILPVITRHLQVDRKVAEETYDLYHNVFSLPPRVGRKGFRGVIDIVLQQMGRPKEEVNLSRLIDESLIDELEREGFFNRLQKEYTQS
ncbi:MAG TPA: ABC transporter substrate-binding protein [Candidatus Binatia bacterium]|jgi:NitT/TauT family transport system substrate-binding protein|nr:ABC transporter substrate-binding protein [Candidatus Binatia bacterium]